MRPNTPGDEERWLWPWVAKSGPDECWPWTRPVGANGYPNVKVSGRSVTVHRYVYSVTTRLPVADVLHRCGNQRCCNPSHLYEGDDKQNAADRTDHGRTARLAGERNGNARLTPAQVLKIRADKRPASVIADEYGISKSHVFKLKAGGRWAHL